MTPPIFRVVVPNFRVPGDHITPGNRFWGAYPTFWGARGPYNPRGSGFEEIPPIFGVLTPIFGVPGGHIPPRRLILGCFLPFLGGLSIFWGAWGPYTPPRS